MKYYGKKNTPERLSQAEEMIASVSIDEELRSRMAAVGYSETQFAEVSELLEVAKRLETNQQVQLGKQTAATTSLARRTQSMRLKFVSDRKITRHVLRDDPALAEELRLHIKTKKGNEALIRQMTHFYEEVITYEALMHELAEEYSLTFELFQMRLEDINRLIQAIQTQQYQKGVFRTAVQERREAMQQLDVWMSRFIKMARLVFYGEEEQLRKLHIHSRIPMGSRSDRGRKDEGEVI